MFVLDAFAAALALENATAAAEFLGAAAHLSQHYELPLSGANVAYQQKFIESVRQQLDTQSFDLAWSRGAQWTVEEVLAAVQQTIFPSMNAI